MKVKLLLLLISFFLCSITSATTFYVSTTGNDASGTGSITNPWKTVKKATSTVTNPGDIIHVNAGTYLETAQLFLAVGVSIEGDGATSVIQCTWPWSFQAVLALDSPEGTNGNQSISYLKFDGRNMTSPRGIEIQGRSNVSMHHCTVVDFKEEGIIISGTVGYTGSAPGIWATGNTFHDNIVTNCSQFAGYGTGCLGIGGQVGMLIYNNTITQPLRSGSQIGWPIKYYNEGWLNGVKIYNNTLIKAPFDGNGWDFALELFNQSGMEIYGNNIQGALDFNFQTKGAYAYSIYIHDNTIGEPAFNPITEDGVIVEYGIEGLWVKNNIFRNLSTGVVFYTRPNAIIKDIQIEKNLFADFGKSNAGVGAFVGGFGIGTNAYTIDGLKVHNNTFSGMLLNKMNDGIGLGDCTSGAIKNVSVRNNHFENITSNVFRTGGTITPDSVAYTNNNTQGITYNSTPQWSHTPTHYTIGSNLSVLPLFINLLNFQLNILSPLVNAGVNVGLPYNGSAPDIGYDESGSSSSNVPPNANAGPDQTITLPLSTVTLAGSGTDADGTIISYAWAKISGPAAGTITNSTAANSTVTGLVQGVYKLELTVTDNGGATAKDTMQITVNPGVNIPPVANAGADQTITLPLSTVTLAGSGTDADGTIATYGWTKISGPAAGTITNPAAAGTTVTGLAQGVYKFELKVTDNSGATDTDTMQVTVNPAANIPPVANAGPDQTIALPLSSVTLAGSGTDADGTIATYAWAKISGPATFNITNPAAAASTVTGLTTTGVYIFQLTVTDNSGATATDIMQVTVNPAGNIPPVANAGTDQAITLPLSSVTLAGSGTDADGTIATYAWAKISGPGTFNITNPAAAGTTVTGLTTAGVYVFQLTVTDNGGATATDVMQVTVNAAANIPPTANAGTDQTITLPLSTVTLAGSGTDADGTIATYAWAKISGPATFNITNPAAANTTVTGLTTAGVYVFQLTVTDNSGATATDNMQVTVNPAANIPPTANAGPDKTITLPTNSVTLVGSGTDPDGTIATYAWAKISGPGTFNITTPAAATTTVTGLTTAGVYVFQLTVTDNSGATATDIMQVTVNPVPNIPPTANAGIDQLITLPVNTVTLSGSGTDADGTITTYAWAKISGPGTFNITTPAAATTTVTGLTAGIYIFQLTVTDNSGATATDNIQVTVNIAPVANAGPDQNITLPLNAVNLAGSGTDADGTIAAYGWTLISGPAGAGTISNANAAATTFTGLIAGVYKLELKVTDNRGATDTDTMQVVVFTPNIPPTANAGLDQSVTLPTNTASLLGSGTDVDGTIISYTWTKIAGPAGGTIANSAAAVTSVSGLTAGIYVYQLRVTDNNGASATDIMQVTVNLANIPPVANAGPDQSVLLPASVTLTGSGTDVDGTIVAYKWRQISGPADKITSPNTAVTVMDNLVAGTYKLELTVTDNKGATGKDTVIVNAANAVAPSQNSAKVYPNPVVTITTVNINSTLNDVPLLLVVTDMNGKAVYQKQVMVVGYTVNEKINMSSLAKGTYFITIFYDGQTKQSLKVLKM